MEEEKGRELHAKNPRSGHKRSTKTALLDTESFSHPWRGGHSQPHHFCLDDFRFLPFYLFSFRDFRQAEHKVKILFLIWNLQVSHFAFQGWSGVKAFLGGAVCSPYWFSGTSEGVGPRPLSSGAQASVDMMLWEPSSASMVSPAGLALYALPSPLQPWPLHLGTHLDDVQLLHAGGHPELGGALAVQTVCNTEAVGGCERRGRPSGQRL